MAPPECVAVHPLVLLSVVDHYNRVAKDTKKRVIGILLGSVSKGEVDVTNSFAVPFEEDTSDPSIWFMDHSYMETMNRMFRKVNARENIVGWYSTGPKIREADLDINHLMSSYCSSDPILVICEVQPKEVGLPIHAYVAQEEVKEEATEKSQKVFQHLPTSVAQTEAEEIGVEHLLRDVKDATISSLSTEVVGKLQALKGLKGRLGEMLAYLQAVLDGKIPVNHEIIADMQDMINLLPNLNVDSLASSLTEQSNGMMMAVYLASMTRAVVSLHNLIENKEARVWHEKKQAAAVEAATKKETDTAAAAAEAADEASKENSSAQKKA